MCEMITSLFSMVIYIFFRYLFTYSYSLFDEGFFISWGSMHLFYITFLFVQNCYNVYVT